MTHTYFFRTIHFAAGKTLVALVAAGFLGLLATGAAQAVEIGETVDIKVQNWQEERMMSKDRGGEAVDGVTKVVMSLIDALETKDFKRMSEIYRNDDRAMFYGASLAQKARGSENFVKAQNQCIETLARLDIQPSDMQVQYLGDVAVATLTGINKAVTVTDEKIGSTWRWSLVMHDAGGGDWRISHEHYSFEALN
ncbi:YybH family protein [Primorskyibacter sp. 2E107]|uniref:YybH family protein n=1 Tax=Primorskyibacter sp. 2E107 TaxID=3403458 RepID=UPI003AF99006